MTPHSLRVLAQYNAWANQRLYQACSMLPAEEMSCRRPSFFGSIIATLNHGLVGDSLWMGRFTGDENHGISALDQILFDDLDGLAQARAEMDACIIAFFQAPLGDLEEMFAYRTIAGQPVSSLRGLTMLHMFNHATHHRGQVHDMLSATHTPPPVLDLIYFLRQ